MVFLALVKQPGSKSMLRPLLGWKHGCLELGVLINEYWQMLCSEKSGRFREGGSLSQLLDKKVY